MSVAVEAVLYLLPRGEADQRFMFARQQMQVPFGYGDIARVERTLEHVDGILPIALTMLVARHGGELCEVACSFRCRLEAPGGKAFEHVAHNRGFRCVRHQYLAALFVFDVVIAERRTEAIIAVLDPCPHLLHGLTAILPTLEFPLRRQHGFNKVAFRRVFKPEVQTFAYGTPALHFTAQLQMKLCVAGIALQVIEDHHVLFMLAGIEITQERDHAGTLHEVTAARDIIGKDADYFIAHGVGILTAAVFLALKAVTFVLLFLT